MDKPVGAGFEWEKELLTFGVSEGEEKLYRVRPK